MAEVILLAGQVLGSPAAVNAWLTCRKRALAFRTPLHEMASLDGCARVEHMLKTLYD